jgi:hypothetical protein
VKAHNESIHLTDWDCIVIDEYHFGAWRDSARSLYDPTDLDIAEFEEPDEWVTEEDLGLNSRNYLYLSGTPFRAITNGEFTEDQVFNWTYVHEQREKASWDTGNGPNPYLELPAMEMYSYKMAPEAAKYAAEGEFSSFKDALINLPFPRAIGRGLPRWPSEWLRGPLYPVSWAPNRGPMGGFGRADAPPSPHQGDGTGPHQPVRRGEQHVQVVEVLRDPAVPGLGEPEVTLHDQERMLDLRPHRRLP